MFAKPLLLLLLSLPIMAQAGPVIEHWQTGNGARVFFVTAPELPIVDVQVVFDAGSARDGDKPGVALLTSDLLSNGAKTADSELNADQIAERFADLGAAFGAGADRDTATVSLRSLTDAKVLQPALELMSQVLHQPTFPQDAFEREQKQMLIGLQSEQQSPEAIAGKTFFTALYGKHPYATEPLGTPESVNKLTRADVLAHYGQYFVSSNAVVAIVGALDRKAAEALAETVVGGLAKGTPPAPLAQVDNLSAAQTINHYFPSAQTHVLMGQPGVKRGDADYFPLIVGNYVLGGGGLVSRLTDEIREKRGLSYSTYSAFAPMEVQGPYTLGLQTRNEQTQNALKVLRDTVQTFVDKGPTAAELDAAKKNLTGGFPLRIDSNGNLIDYLGMIGFYGLPLDYLDTYTQNVEKVTLEQIQDAYKRRVKPDAMVTVIVGGGAENPPPTEPASPPSAESKAAPG